MLKYLLIFISCSLLWAEDSTTFDTIHVYDISHHINTRSNKSTPFDWFANIDTKYEYTKGINPEFRFYASTERDDDTVFNAHIVRIQSDYFFVEDNVDEEHSVNTFSVGAHHKWQMLKAGYAVSIEHDLYHGLYAEIDHKFLEAYILFMDVMYRYHITPKLKVNFGYHDMFYFEAKAHYTKELNTNPFWEAGTKVGFLLCLK